MRTTLVVRARDAPVNPASPNAELTPGASAKPADHASPDKVDSAVPEATNTGGPAEDAASPLQDHADTPEGKRRCLMIHPKDLPDGWMTFQMTKPSW